jgi:hypothetical protein
MGSEAEEFGGVVVEDEAALGGREAGAEDAADGYAGFADREIGTVEDALGAEFAHGEVEDL